MGVFDERLPGGDWSDERLRSRWPPLGDVRDLFVRKPAGGTTADHRFALESGNLMLVHWRGILLTLGVVAAVAVVGTIFIENNRDAANSAVSSAVVATV